ncbi:hypothetical protein ACLOJK_011996 [Asimina triloba]
MRSSTLGRGDGKVEGPEFVASQLFPTEGSMENVVTQRFVFSAAKIAALGAGQSPTVTKSIRPSRVKAVAALIWRCMLRIHGEERWSTGTTFMAIQALNLRGRISQPLTPRFSNEIYTSLKGDHMKRYLEGKLWDATRQVDGNYVRELKKQVELQGPSSSPWYEADFGPLGVGSPFWFVLKTPCSYPLKNCVMLMGTRCGEGIEAWTILSNPLLSPHLLNFRLTLLDQRFPRIYTPQLKKSLSETLTRFYPLAGRVAQDGLAIECNDEGVDFLPTSVEGGRLSDFLLEPHVDVLNQWFRAACGRRNQTGRCSWPCKSMCSYFERGGMEIGASLIHKIVDASTYNALEIGASLIHKIVDASTYNAFINAWSCVSSRRHVPTTVVSSMEKWYVPTTVVRSMEKCQQAQHSGRIHTGAGPVQRVQQPMPIVQQQMFPRGRVYRYPPGGRNIPDVPVQGVTGGMLPAHDTSGMQMRETGIPQPVPIKVLASALADALPDEQRTMLGETKVTGMLLEMDQTEVLHLLESPEALKVKVAEAMDVLRNVAQQQPQANSVSD